MSQKIIDVSYHNGTIDWQKVKDAGYHAIIRLGYGQEIASQRDKQAVRNVQECERLGIPYGLYLYSYADGSAKASGEAQHAIGFIEEFCSGNFKYPCFIDIEEKKLLRHAPIVAITFCNVLSKSGYKTGVYASESVWLSQLKDFSPRADVLNFSKWVAKWSDKMPEVVNMSLWQYTDKGSVPGVIGACDISYGYFDISVSSNGAKSAYTMALNAIAGEYGNGEDRKKNLGIDYERVQALVNYMFTGFSVSTSSMSKIVDLVLQGAYGNGEERKHQLGSLYESVQKAVNERLR